MNPMANGHAKPTPNDTALAYLASGRIPEALEILQEQAWKEPSYKAFCNYAVALRHAGQFETAIDYLHRAIKLDMRLPNAWLTLANTYNNVGEWDKELQYYQGAYSRLRVDDKDAAQQVALGLGQSLLRQRRFQEAWKYWELGRYCRSWGPLPSTKPWGGEAAECVLVLCEGGFGDAMLFGRWLPYVAAVAKRVKLLVWKSMVDFRDWKALGVDEIIPQDGLIKAKGITHSVSWMSLPAIVGMDSVLDIPRDSGMVEICNDDFHDGKVGFAWRAEENSQLRRSRSLSKLEAEQIAAHFENVYSLCPHGKQLAQATQEEWPSNVIQDDSRMNTWAATTDLIHSCKLVISVDTAVAHLAGLCGVPTLLLLPCSSDWKWGTPENTPTDPWYGPHVCYFRNKDPLNWDIEGIVEAASCQIRSA